MVISFANVSSCVCVCTRHVYISVADHDPSKYYIYQKKALTVVTDTILL